MKNLFKKPSFLIAFLLLIVFSFLDKHQLSVKNTSDLLNLLSAKPTSTITPTPTVINVLGTNENQTFKVVRIVDGDTIEIEGGEKIRYIGINTPEIDDKDPIKLCFAEKAALKNKELVEEKQISLVKDVSETDKYGRLLRYVYIGDIFINDFLMRQGFAQISTYPPDVKFKQQFQEAEQEARQNKRGLWGEECLIE